MSAERGHLTILRAANGLCPRCAASLGESVQLCEQHDDGNGLCAHCGSRHRVRVAFDCPNCVFAATPAVADALLADLEVVRFLVDHDINPVAPTQADVAVWIDYEEEVTSVDPFEGRFTFTADGETLTLTVDDDLSVVDATRGRGEGSH